MEYNKNAKVEYKELTVLQQMLNDDVFKKYITGQLKAELDDLKSAYNAKDLQELAELKGYHKGLKFTQNIVNAIEGRIKLLKEELNRYDKGSC